MLFDFMKLLMSLYERSRKVRKGNEYLVVISIN